MRSLPVVAARAVELTIDGTSVRVVEGVRGRDDARVDDRYEAVLLKAEA